RAFGRGTPARGPGEGACRPAGPPPPRRASVEPRPRAPFLAPFPDLDEVAPPRRGPPRRPPPRRGRGLCDARPDGGDGSWRPPRGPALGPRGAVRDTPGDQPPPRSAFVAGFVGTPRINLIEGRIEAGADRPGLVL